MERARQWEDRAADAFVSVAYGFAYADVPDVGATVMVVTNDDQKLADEIADDMADYIWRVREPFAGQTLPETEEGVALAISAALVGKMPVHHGAHGRPLCSRCSVFDQPRVDIQDLTRDVRRGVRGEKHDRLSHLVRRA